MNEIKISVIIPTYNSSNTIERLIQSLLYQTFKDFELIFIDDNSSDDTTDIITKALENQKITYQLFVNETNKGPAYSRNKGIVKSNGDFIVFIDSDDMVREDHLYTLYNNLKNYDSVFIKGLKVDDDDNLLNFQVNRFDPIMNLSKENYFLIKAKDIIKLELLMKIPFSFVFLIYKKDLILKNKLSFNEDFRYGEDTDFAIRYLANCNYVKFINKYTYYYYQEKDSISKSSSLVRFEAVKLFESLHTYFNSRGNKEIADLVIHSRVPKFIFGNMNYFFYNDYDKDEIFKKMDELDLFDKLKEFNTFTQDDWKFKLKIRLFLLNPDIYYKLWIRFKNRIQ